MIFTAERNGRIVQLDDVGIDLDATVIGEAPGAREHADDQRGQAQAFALDPPTQLWHTIAVNHPGGHG
jgi:hypothetical protein